LSADSTSAGAISLFDRKNDKCLALSFY